MLIAVPEKINGKFHYSEDGGYLDDPYTEEEKKICDEFIERIKKSEDNSIVIEG